MICCLCCHACVCFVRDLLCEVVWFASCVCLCLRVCVCVRGLGGSMCLCALYVNYCVRFYGVVCRGVCLSVMCLRVVCGVLYDGGWMLFCCCSLCWCFVNMFVWCSYGLLCAVVWIVLVLLCVRAVLNVFVCFVCALRCDVV